MKIFVQIHGGWCFGREEWRWKGEEVERKCQKREKVKMEVVSDYELRVLLNEVEVQLMMWIWELMGCQGCFNSAKT